MEIAAVNSSDVRKMNAATKDYLPGTRGSYKHTRFGVRLTGICFAEWAFCEVYFRKKDGDCCDWPWVFGEHKLLLHGLY